MKHFFTGIQIVRPLNIILGIFSVLIAAFLIGSLYSPLIPYVILSVICFSGASYILNDILDVRIDRVNCPERPLPSGQLSIFYSLFLMGTLYLTGIVACTYLHTLGQQIALFIVLPLLILYTPLLKNLPLLGNIVVGGILGLVFIFTEGSLQGNVDKMWIPFALAMSLSVIRELCKDGADIHGDSIANLQTFPRRYGTIATLWLLRIMGTAFCFFAIIPYINGRYGILYFIILFIGVELPLLYCLYIILSKKSGVADYLRVSKILKGVTMIGMVAILSSAY